jgi:Arc/MetJ-type ribon-helix-helix transcriptional regulator
MGAAKVAITLDPQLLHWVDRWVDQGKFANRSQAIQKALREKMERWKRLRLSQEVSKLNPLEERELAEEVLAGEEWLEY